MRLVWRKIVLKFILNNKGIRYVPAVVGDGLKPAATWRPYRMKPWRCFSWPLFMALQAKSLVLLASIS
jgi:hypothetical protein